MGGTLLLQIVHIRDIFVSCPDSGKKWGCVIHVYIRCIIVTNSEQSGYSLSCIF